MADLVRRLQILESTLETRLTALQTSVDAQQETIQRMIVESVAHGDAQRGDFEQVRKAIADQAATVQNLQAAQNELRAAQAAQVTTARGGGGPGLVDTRLLGKPEMFTGEATKWRDFKLIFSAYCGAVNPRLEELMHQQVGLETMRSLGDLAPMDAALSVQLSFMLTLLLRGGALEKVRNATEQRNGLEVWRLLLREYEPQVRARWGGMLANIIATRFAGMDIAEFDAFDAACKRYVDQSSRAIDDQVKISVVLNGVSNEKLLEHLQLNQEKFETYAELKTMISNYFMLKRTWGSPMDVDALTGK